MSRVTLTGRIGVHVTLEMQGTNVDWRNLKPCDIRVALEQAVRRMTPADLEQARFEATDVRKSSASADKPEAA